MMKKTGFACMLAFVGFAGAASAVMLDTEAFLHRCTVTFSGYAGSETLTNFPALVRIPANSEIYADSPDGRNICFADAEGNLAPCEIDVWNPDGESLVWVRVPELAGQTTTLTLYSGGLPSLQNVSGDVWKGADYRGVWHFSGSNKDSSPNELVSENSSPTPPTFTDAGAVGTAFYSGGSSHVGMPVDDRWADIAGRNVSLSAWVKSIATGSIWSRIFSCKADNTDEAGFELTLQKGTTNYNARATGQCNT